MPTTWNPNDKGNITLSNNNLTARLADLSGCSVRSTTYKTSGKWYFECTANWVSAEEDNSDVVVGIARSELNVSNAGMGEDPYSWGIYWRPTQFVYDLMHGGSDTLLSGPGADGDVIGICVDLDNFKLYATKNGTNLLGNPSALTGGATIDAVPMWAGCGNAFRLTVVPVITTNFGATAFAFGPPSGFTAWDSTPFTQKRFSAGTASFTRILKPVGT